MRLCIEGKAAKRSGCRGWGGAWGRLSHVCCLGGRGRRLIAALAKREDKVSTYDRNRAVQWQRKKRMREGTACDGGAVRHSSHQGGGGQGCTVNAQVVANRAGGAPQSSPQGGGECIPFGNSVGPSPELRAVQKGAVVGLLILSRQGCWAAVSWERLCICRTKG